MIDDPIASEEGGASPNRFLDVADFGLIDAGLGGALVRTASLEEFYERCVNLMGHLSGIRCERLKITQIPGRDRFPTTVPWEVISMQMFTTTMGNPESSE